MGLCKFIIIIITFILKFMLFLQITTQLGDQEEAADSLVWSSTSLSQTS